MNLNQNIINHIHYLYFKNENKKTIEQIKNSTNEKFNTNLSTSTVYRCIKLKYLNQNIINSGNSIMIILDIWNKLSDKSKTLLETNKLSVQELLILAKLNYENQNEFIQNITYRNKIKSENIKSIYENFFLVNQLSRKEKINLIKNLIQEDNIIKNHIIKFINDNQYKQI